MLLIIIRDSVTLSGVARKLRVEFPGAIYHVMNRGDRREAIFHDDADRQRFLAALEEPLRTYRWSSWPVYLPGPSKRPAWLCMARLLGECGMEKDSPAGRRRLEEALEERRGAEAGD